MKVLECDQKLVCLDDVTVTSFNFEDIKQPAEGVFSIFQVANLS